MRGSPFESLKRGKLNLKQEYSSHEVFNFACARLGLYEFLSQYAHTGQTIYYPDFICRDFLAPAYNLNLNVKFYHVRDDLSCDLSSIEKAEFIIMVNYFGFPSDANAFRLAAEKTGAVLIEDNAHGFLSRDSNGKPLGTRADVGIVSIRKTTDLNNAGILLLSDAFSDFIDSEKNYRGDKLKSRIKKMLKAFFPFLPKPSGMGLLRLLQWVRRLKTGSIYPFEPLEAEFTLPKFEHIQKQLQSSVLLISKEDEIQYRRRSFEKIKVIAEKYNIKPVNINYSDGICPYCFGFIEPTDNADLIAFEAELFLLGFFSLPWPSLPSTFYVDTKNAWMQKVRMVPFNW